MGSIPITRSTIFDHYAASRFRAASRWWNFGRRGSALKGLETARPFGVSIDFNPGRVRPVPLPSRFFPQDQKQRVLVERYLMSVSAYVLGLACAWSARASGLIRFDNAALVVATLLIGVQACAGYWLYRSGRNRRFDDSVLTRIQMLVATAWCTYFISGVQELRGVSLMFYLFIAMFSFFTLNQWQTAQIGVVISSAYGAVVVWDWWNSTPGISLGVNVIQWAILSVMLLGLWMIARYMAQVREKIQRSTRMIEAQNQQIRQTNEELNEALARLEQLATTDELTGLSNRRHFLTTVDRHIAHCRSDQLSFGLCVLDLDHFKRVNDEYGHQVGDHVLATCARVMSEHMREYDFLARFGGEELVLIVTRGDEDITRACAERLRLAAENADLGSVPPGCTLTVSVGSTVFRWGDTLEAALGRADQALYEAKRAGRNRCRFIAGGVACSLP